MEIKIDYLGEIKEYFTTNRLIVSFIATIMFATIGIYLLPITLDSPFIILTFIPICLTFLNLFIVLLGIISRYYIYKTEKTGKFNMDLFVTIHRILHGKRYLYVYRLKTVHSEVVFEAESDKLVNTDGKKVLVSYGDNVVACDILSVNLIEGYVTLGLPEVLN